ncbi:hypothetical protein GCM10022243_53910 [Saccharothrix violaceirubra]
MPQSTVASGSALVELSVVLVTCSGVPNSMVWDEVSACAVIPAPSSRIPVVATVDAALMILFTP